MSKSSFVEDFAVGFILMFFISYIMGSFNWFRPRDFLERIVLVVLGLFFVMAAGHFVMCTIRGSY